jgi:DNA-3-methyladenine glycosylase
LNLLRRRSLQTKKRRAVERQHTPESDRSGVRKDVAGDVRWDKARRLPRSFFDREPRRVARELLGKLLVRRTGRTLLAGRIVEDEAYLGVGDPAAHAAAGRTPRNQVIFGPPGRAYVYFVYGNHYCLNVSCMPEGNAGSVLFRALEPVAGLSRMARNRRLPSPAGNARALRALTSGPGRLSQAMAITRARDNGKDLVGGDLFFADDGFRPKRIVAGPRVGITKAATWPLRYFIARNPFVSKPSAAKAGTRSRS